MSWPRDAFEALRQIVLIETRINTMTDTVKELAALLAPLGNTWSPCPAGKTRSGRSGPGKRT